MTTLLRSKMIPRAALIAYTLDDEKGREQYHVEARPIGDDGMMGEAIPVTYDFLMELASNFSSIHSDVARGRLPGNLLYADTRQGMQKYIWYDPPGHRMMYFSKGLSIDDAEYNIPGVIYVAEGDKLSVYSYKGRKPTPETELCLAPFFNVTGASVCLGSAKIEKPSNPTFDQTLEYWERRFWLTEFSHLGGGMNPTKRNLVLVTKETRDKDFPLSELKKTDKKLKDLLK